MKYTFLIIALLFIASELKSQSIVAGKHGVTDLYTNYNPDTVIWCLSGHMCSHLETPVDMNNDGIPDITIISNNSAGAMGFGNNYVKIDGNRINQIATTSVNSCGNELAKVFSENESIESADTWSYATQNLKIHSWFMGSNTCYASASEKSSFIVGTKIFANSDTLYGWIRVSSIYIDSWDTYFTIQEYACNKGSTEEIEPGNENNIKVYPNPCTDFIYVELNSQATPVMAILTDINGLELLRQTLIDKESRIDVSKLPAGIYILKVIDVNYIFDRKIIVSRD